jgi:hypothetical protein
MSLSNVPTIILQGTMSRQMTERRSALLWALKELRPSDLNSYWLWVSEKRPYLHREEQEIVDAMAVRLEREGVTLGATWKETFSDAGLTLDWTRKATDMVVSTAERINCVANPDHPSCNKGRGGSTNTDEQSPSNETNQTGQCRSWKLNNTWTPDRITTCKQFGIGPTVPPPRGKTLKTTPTTQTTEKDNTAILLMGALAAVVLMMDR